VHARWLLALLALLALTLLRLLVAATAPLSPDEAYYWVWSKALAAGYFDHPPMVALWVWAGTHLAGDGALGVRLLAPLAAAIGSLLLAQTAEDLLPGRRAGPLAAALLNATLLFGAGAVTMTPDTPLLLFWTATLWACARLRATRRGAWWLAAGLAAGLACDSKYTAVLLAPVLLLWLLWVPGLRPWLRRPLPWAAALLAGLCFAPVLAWNAVHGWVSLAKQGGRVGAWEPARAPQFLAELVGGQLGLATPLLAVLFAAGIVLAARRAWAQEPAGSLLALAALVPVAVFVQHALGARVQANWPAILFPAAAVAAAGLAGGWQRWNRPALALGFVLTGLVYLQATLAPLPLPARFDPTLSRLAGWPGLAADVARAVAESGATYVAVDNYGDAAELTRALPPRLPVIGTDARWRYFALAHAGSVIAGRPGLLLRRAGERAPPDATLWARVGPPANLSRARDGLVAETYRLYPVVGVAGMPPVVALPRRP
jgi:4-amino-4-deoxy-L-arabinose transferase-like glycosyltransferase